MQLVTGGCGFIGSNYISSALKKGQDIVNLDALTYAGNADNIKPSSGGGQYHFIEGNILNPALISDILDKYKPSSIVHFAAESHVDNSISGPAKFLETNITGTFHMVECAKTYWHAAGSELQEKFRFLHISTDEVFGSLGQTEPRFREDTPYAPRSPYSASKASSDHIVSAYHSTFGLPAMISNCSNNFGPYQSPEKLIPKIISNALSSQPIPIYGDGKQIRDWLYVADHCDAIFAIVECGQPGHSYNIGGDCEVENIEVARLVCEILQTLKPRADLRYCDLIRFVTDRLGHDRRYAVDGSKIREQLGWQPSHSFESALEKTIAWYLDNETWLETMTAKLGALHAEQ